MLRQEHYCKYEAIVNSRLVLVRNPSQNNKNIKEKAKEVEAGVLPQVLNSLGYRVRSGLGGRKEGGWGEREKEGGKKINKKKGR